MALPDLNTIWFVLVGVLFTGYAMLDGFDLGVGQLHLLAKGDQERRIMLNAIGPVWDGNEVWLVTGGGALFAAFPEVYATVFSGFYLPFVLLLVALIFRAVAIEFRSKQPMRWWRAMWDWSFFGGALLSALLIGVTMGNIAWGLPLDSRGEFAGSFLGLLHPYALILGVTTVALFMMHGAIYVLMKTEGALHDRARGWVNPVHHLLHHMLRDHDDGDAHLCAAHDRARSGQPMFFLVALASMLAIANIPREIHYGRDFRLSLFGAGHGRADDAEDTGHHAHHRDHRRAGRPRLHGQHLLDLPRQGKARPDRAILLTDRRSIGETPVHGTTA